MKSMTLMKSMALMKSMIMTAVLLSLSSPAAVWAQETPAEDGEAVEAESEVILRGAGDRSFVGPTAKLTQEGRWEIGLFGPLRYGFSDTMELAVHPLLFFVSPNLQVKLGHGERGGWELASKHQVTYPTPLLRLLAREGIGGILPSDRAVPHIISLQSELLASREFGQQLITFGLGVQVAPRFGESQLVSIDLPFVYPRTAAAFGWATGIARVGAQGPIAGRLGYEAEVRAFTYPGVEGAFALEQGAGLRWTSSPSFMVQAGYRLSYAGYPFGRMFNIVPTVELAWGF